MIKQLLIYALALTVILGSATMISERARAFLMIGQTSIQSTNFLLVTPGVMALAATRIALRVQ